MGRELHFAKSIFFPLSSYPKPTASAAISRAITVADVFGAHLTAVAFGLDVRLPTGAYTHAIAFGDYIAGEYRRCTANAKAAVDEFQIEARRQAISHTARFETCMPMGVSDRIVELSHVHDLSVVAVKSNDGGQRDMIEDLLFGSGRPLLLFPEAVAKDLPRSFEKVTIAWNNSGPAARSVADALPLLRTAREIRVVSIDEGPNRRGSRGYEQSSLDLVQCLSRLGVEASFAAIDRKEDSIDQVLTDDALVSQSDLLVMGGYGHSRLKELILGGVTDTILREPPGFVLLSH